MRHLIKTVDAGSIADEVGITSGCFLLDISGHEVLDIIDYEQFTCTEELIVRFETPEGDIIEAEIEKDMYEPLGITFERSLMSPVRQCKNRCVFCFIDQMPRSGRETLHFKDDDWRLSLIMGNYVTLTNVDEDEFTRILERRVSPLYISVHATDGEVRRSIMRNPSTTLIMDRLQRLQNAGMMFHAQIVLCPGLNDGEILQKTLDDLLSLTPAAQSVAIVPVGLTRFRDGLYPLRCLTADEARLTIDMIHSFQQKSLNKTGTRLAYASDEMYVLAGYALPEYHEYDDFPQIENGVGLLRKYEYEFLEALETKTQISPTAHFIGVSGMCAYGFMYELVNKLKPYGIDIDLRAVKNTVFGETATVTGLLCGYDIIRTLGSEAIGKTVLLPQNMFREREDVFLDGMTLKELEHALSCRVIKLSCFDGGESADIIFNAANMVNNTIKEI